MSIPKSSLPEHPGAETIERILAGELGDATGVDATTVDATTVDGEAATPTVEPGAALPAHYQNDDESLVDSHYGDHLKTHWGF